MCDIWKSTADAQLGTGDILRQMESLENLGVAWVVLSGGEALMHPRLWEITTMLRARHIRITLLSSGLLLQRNAARVAEEIDDLIVSLDGPPPVHDSIRGVTGAFDALSQGIIEIRRLRPEFSIGARCTVQRQNADRLCEVVDTAQELQLNSISFLAADVASTAFHRPAGWPRERQDAIGAFSRDELDSLRREIEALLLHPRRHLIRESADKLRRILRHFRALQGLEPAMAPRCNAPWTSAVVEADGDVRPCFFHRPVGTLRSGLPLEAILNGPEAVAFRQSLDVATNPICRQCVCSLDWKGV